MKGAPTPPQAVRRLNSPGPISDAFLLSRAFVACIIGPVGSAKSMTALRKLRRVGQKQKGVLDGQGRLWRKARCGVLRETYPAIDKNILPSWFRIHPEREGTFSRRAPYSHQLRLILGKDAQGQANDILDLEMEFRAIGDNSVEEACRGWEVNAVMVDEADLQPANLVAFLAGRVGRFSDLDPSLVVDPQIILSLNAPYIDNWVYKLAVEKELGDLSDPALMAALQGRPLIETFIQPGGLEPTAENLHNLPNGRGYYLIQAALNKNTPGYVDRMINNKFVPMQHGLPVYAGFNYAEHVAEDLAWDRRRKLVVGCDQGLFAAAVLTQRTIMGELRVLDECVANDSDHPEKLRKLGASAFGKMLRAKILERCPDIRRDQIRVVLDPAAFAADDREDNEQDWVKAFQKALGWKVYRAKSNREHLRLPAVRNAQGERGGYLVDKRCKHLIRGHLGGYRYQKANLAGGETRGHLEIADTVFTHVCDAEQYAALEGEHVIDDIRGRDRRSGPRVVRNDSDYNELEGVR